MEKVEIRRQLLMLGFVRVDGLKARRSNDEWVMNPAPGEGYAYGQNNSMEGFAFPDGEVWVASMKAPEKTILQRADLIFQLGVRDNRSGLWIHLSNGEQAKGYDLIRRLADPDYQPQTV
jgi:hypothetical protein